MKNLNVMIKPASSLCNMRCKYCFYADVASHREIRSHGVMSEETVDRILANLRAELNEGDRVCFTFQGGEPTLVGLPFFEYFVAQTTRWKDVAISYALQTNGILIDEAWCAFLKKYDFLVGVSFDLLPDVHDRTRLGADQKGTYDKVLSAIRLLRRHGVRFNVLCTLTGEIARHPERVWNQLVKLDIGYVQFTPCLGELDKPASGDAYALTPKRFAAFYTRLFALWYRDYRVGKYRSVKLFDDVVNLAVLGIPTSCGMSGYCQPQLVVEADGSTYPCDFYCLDAYCMGNLTEHTVSQLLATQALKDFLAHAPTLPTLCDTCRYRRFCGGNCKRMRREICCDAADSFCGYRDFLDQCGPALFELAERVRKSRG